MNEEVRPAHRRRIYLLRHGEVSYFDANGKPLNTRQVDLTERGHRQAEAAGHALRDIAFDRAICTGLPRTVQTISPILEGRDLALETHSELAEIRPGSIRDFPPEVIKQNFPKAFEVAIDDTAAFWGGETYAAFVPFTASDATP